MTVAALDLALALNRAIEPHTDVATCFSPYSMSSALGMAATASGGATREQLAAALSHDLDRLAEQLSAAAELTGNDDAVLRVANTAWLSDGLAVEPGFARRLKGWPNGQTRSAPFRTDPGSSVRQINEQVGEITRGLITNLVEPAAVSPSTLAVLVNALYLKVGWLVPFPAGATRPREFHTPTGTVRAGTMELTEQLGYARTAGWQVVTASAGGDVQAVILLPDEPLADAEPRLSGELLAGMLDGVGPTRVQLRLPRLRLTARTPLNGPLRTLGVRDLFDRDRADLTALTPVRPAWVDAVLHEAVLRVDEGGIEGAAATAVVMRTVAYTRPAQPLLVEVNRPFLLLIRHRPSGEIYFLARVTEPGDIG